MTINELHLFISKIMEEYEGSRASEFLDPSISNDLSYWLHSRKLLWRKKRGKFLMDDGPSCNKRHKKDDDVDDDPDEGHRISHFLNPTTTFSEWIISRKAGWRKKWRMGENETARLEMGTDTHLNSCFLNWLAKSKTLWRKSILLRRKEKHSLFETDKKQKCPRDILPIFDPNLGLPDDVVAYALSYLPSHEHIRLLYVNKTTSRMIKTREGLWRNLCPTHWILPKRPRKPLYEIYFNGLHKFEERKNKRSDDLLTKASETLAKGDYLQTFAKIVSEGERSFEFEINYTSGTVEERNSLLNLAVINGRLKCVRWLIEVKRADIETFDRGLFTPICNAAWNGDIQMVRYLLKQGASRNKIAKFHSSSGIAPKHEGMTPEEWARKRGHHSIADLIQQGL